MLPAFQSVLASHFGGWSEKKAVSMRGLLDLLPTMSVCVKISTDSDLIPCSGKNKKSFDIPQL